MKLNINIQVVISHLVGRVNDYKEEYSLRLIIMRCQASTCFLENAFFLLLKNLLPPSEFVVNCTAEFFEYIKTLKISHDCILGNVDVKSLFPSIEVTEVSPRVNDLRDCSKNFNDNMKMTLKRGLQLIISSKFFILMGNCISKNGNSNWFSYFGLSSRIQDFKMRGHMKKEFF